MCLESVFLLKKRIGRNHFFSAENTSTFFFVCAIWYSGYLPSTENPLSICSSSSLVMVDPNFSVSSVELVFRISEVARAIDFFKFTKNAFNPILCRRYGFRVHYSRNPY